MSNDDSGALAPVERKQVNYYDDAFAAVKADDGQVYISVRRLGAAHGLSAQAQTRRIPRQPIQIAVTTGQPFWLPPAANSGRGYCALTRCRSDYLALAPKR